MSCEMRNKAGKLIGQLSDSMDGEDFLIIDNKRVPLSEVQASKKLKAAFNDSIKTPIVEDNNE